jgi:hypothetical protein
MSFTPHLLTTHPKINTPIYNLPPFSKKNIYMPPFIILIYRMYKPCYVDDIISLHTYTISPVCVIALLSYVYVYSKRSARFFLSRFVFADHLILTRSVCMTTR